MAESADFAMNITLFGADQARMKLDALAKSQQNVASASDKAASAMGVLEGALGALALGILVNNTITAAREIQNLAYQMGVSVAAADAWIDMAAMSGIGAETLSRSVMFLSRTLSDNRQVVTGLGVEVGTLEETFFDTLRALQKIEDPARRNAATLKIFGRGAKELTPLLSQNVDALERYYRANQESAIITEKNLGRIGELRMAFAQTKDKVEELVLSLLAGAAPALSATLNVVTGFVAKLGEMNELFGGIPGAILATATAALIASFAISKMVVAFAALRGVAGGGMMGPLVLGSLVAGAGVGVSALGGGQNDILNIIGGGLQGAGLGGAIAGPLGAIVGGAFGAIAAAMRELNRNSERTATNTEKTAEHTGRMARMTPSVGGFSQADALSLDQVYSGAFS